MVEKLLYKYRKSAYSYETSSHHELRLLVNLCKQANFKAARGAEEVHENLRYRGITIDFPSRLYILGLFPLIGKADSTSFLKLVLLLERVIDGNLQEE